MKVQVSWEVKYFLKRPVSALRSGSRCARSSKTFDAKVFATFGRDLVKAVKQVTLYQSGSAGHWAGGECRRGGHGVWYSSEVRRARPAAVNEISLVRYLASTCAEGEYVYQAVRHYYSKQTDLSMFKQSCNDVRRRTESVLDHAMRLQRFKLNA